jgi:ankyrin repeat protein
MGVLSATEPLAGDLLTAIKSGDLATLRRLLDSHDALAAARIGGPKARTPLHVVTDWPGHFPEGPATVRMLVGAGADPNARIDPDEPSETPLHWAASSDDLEVAEALLDAGAEIDPTGGVIAGGTPLDNACAFGCWNVAHLLARRGARIYALWHAAALGRRDAVDQLLGDDTPQEELNHAFWQACHGGQPRMAAYLLSRGADLQWHPDHNDATPLQIAGQHGTRRDYLVTWLEKNGAK